MQITLGIFSRTNLSLLEAINLANEIWINPELFFLDLKGYKNPLDLIDEFRGSSNSFDCFVDAIDELDDSINFIPESECLQNSDPEYLYDDYYVRLFCKYFPTFTGVIQVNLIGTDKWVGVAIHQGKPLFSKIPNGYITSISPQIGRGRGEDGEEIALYCLEGIWQVHCQGNPNSPFLFPDSGEKGARQMFALLCKNWAEKCLKNCS